MKTGNLIICLLIVAAYQAQAGEPIQFSEPRRTVKTPSANPVEEMLNKPIEKFNPRNSLGDPVTPSFQLPQPTIIIQKKNNRDEFSDNPFLKQENETSDYNDFNQYKTKDSFLENSRKNLSPVEQYLLRQEKSSSANRQRQQNMERQSMPFDPNKKESEFLTRGKEDSLNADKNPFNLMRYDSKLSGLFGSRDTLSGKSISGIDDGIKTLMELREKEMAEKQNKERMEAFRRLLGDVPSPQANPLAPKDLVNSAQDLTRRNDNPIAVSPNERLNFMDRNNPRLRFEDYKNMRDRMGLPDDKMNSPYMQNRNFMQDYQQDSAAEREKQKPRPLLTPIPRRPF